MNMKRLSFLFSLILILIFSSQVYGLLLIADSETSASGGNCSSCAVSEDIFDAGITTSSAYDATYWRAWGFTLSETKCVTGISWEVFDGGASGNVIFDIRYDSGGDPGAVVSGCTVTVDSASITDSYSQGSETQGNFSIQMLSAGDYFVVLRMGTLASFAYGLVSGSGNFKYSDDDGATWNTSSWPGQVRVIGCPPSGGAGISPPTVTTQAVDAIHDNNATAHGTITATGGANATKEGVCYSLAPNVPTVEDNKVESTGSFGVGSYSQTMTGLSSNSTYYARYYGLNSGGLGYGDQVQFNTTGSPPAGCSWYVDTGGNNTSGDGSSGQPWLTVAYTLSQSNYGEVVCINDGTYNEGQLVVPAGVSLRSTSANASKVTIQPNVNMNVLTPFLKLHTATPGSDGNQTISYLGINGHTTSYSCSLAISIKNRNNVRIHHCNIHDFYVGVSSTYGAHGIVVRSSTEPSGYWNQVWPIDPGVPGDDSSLDATWPANPVKNLEIDHNEIVNCGRDDDSNAPYGGLWLYSLKDSSIHDNYIDNTSNFGECIYSTPSYFNNVDIYNNTLKMATLSDRSSYIIEIWMFRGGCEIYGNDANAGFSIAVGKETKIYDNIIKVPDPHLRRGYGIEFTGQTFGELYNNYINGVWTGIALGLDSHMDSKPFWIRGTIVKRNVITNLKKSGILLLSSSDNQATKVEDFKIYNSTIDGNVNSDYTLIGVLQENNGIMNDIEVKNNIMVNSIDYAGSTRGTITNLEIENNLFWNNPHNVWINGGDVNTIIANPDVNGTGSKPDPWYTLQAGSPAIDAGIDVGLSYNGTAPDIGAYETD